MKCIANPINLLLLLLFLATTTTYGQDTTTTTVAPPANYSFPPYEVGILAGGSNAYGDMVDASLIKFDETNLSYGIFFRYTLSPEVNVRLNALRGMLTGTDLDSDELAERGFSFESPITEISLVGEWDILGRQRYAQQGRFKRTISPYLYAGIGVSLTDVMPDFDTSNGNAVLAEEVQMDLSSQKSTHIAVPFGLGVKADINEQWALGLEFGMRPVFNDYLDGLSMAANPDKNDWYSVGNLTVGYRFGEKKVRRADNSTAQDSSGRSANFTPFEVGLLAGGAHVYGDMVDTATPEFGETNIAYGLYFRYLLNRNFSMRLNVLRGKISATDADSDSPQLMARGISFESPLTEISVVGEWDFLGKRRYTDRGHFKKTVSPYLFAGVGTALTDVALRYPSPDGMTSQRVQQDIINQKTTHITVPMGIGAKADINKQISVGLEFGMRPVFNDYLDGVSVAGNPDKNDWYSFANLLVGYRFGSTDSDLDGIADKEDACPDRRGLAAFQGCPDSDEDGIPDKEDGCPTVAGNPDAGGCPDQDMDGVPDDEDKCPTAPGWVESEGCPDTDRDGVLDEDDECVTVPGLPEFNGCRDTDGDGIKDPEDQCPYLKGTKEFYGCPKPDRDNDGILNSEDRCPDTPGLINGCPDTDDDGLTDDVDKCPDLPGPQRNEGCPELSEEDKEILQAAIDNVRFNTANYKLISTSFPVLDQIGDLMKRYPNYHLLIEGYTDSRGNDFANQQLSEYRAQAVANYLKDENGIAMKRLHYRGRGETNPRATNDTASGRRLNRRVEFTLAPKSQLDLRETELDKTSEDDSEDKE